MENRMTLCNMVIEDGGRTTNPCWLLMQLQIRFLSEYRFDISKLEPLVTKIYALLLLLDSETRAKLPMVTVPLSSWSCLSPRSQWIPVLLISLLLLVVECMHFSAVFFQVDQGGWAPLVIADAVLLIMYD
ncbi:Potassium transporter [Salvia divinorum]